MKRATQTFLPCFIVLCLFALTSWGSEQNNQRSPAQMKNEFGGWYAYSTSSMQFIGRTKNVRQGIMGLHYARSFSQSRSIDFKYTLEAIPSENLSYPINGTNSPIRSSNNGAGISPLGLQLNFGPRNAFQPFVMTSGGFVYFNEDVPDQRGTKFNFTLDIGTGVQLKISPLAFITLGYKFHHVSNGFTGQINPGFDTNMFYVGYGFRS